MPRKLLPSEQKEKHIEQYLKGRVETLGGIAYKFTSPGRRSVPDRVCVFPNGTVIFVECKRPGAKPTPAQYREMKKLEDLNQWVYWVSTKGEVDRVINFWKERLDG